MVAIGGIHGNEPAGVRALERLFELLAEEPLINPGFTFKGELLALRGNLEALNQGKRFIDTDLNRIWRPTPLDGKVQWQLRRAGATRTAGLYRDGRRGGAA